ncbi:MAG: hypothetical protein JXR70_01400 [Spirochaetales bacterium]|nr:hypothetical protein [Spirochaetales bacterium]
MADSENLPDQEPVVKEEPKTENLNFFQKVIAFITGQADPNFRKQRALKEIGKWLKKNRQKFYNPKNRNVLPGLAKFFYEFYKVLGPAQAMVNHAESSAALKTIVIESFLTKDQAEVKNNFTEDAIRERVKITEINQLTEELKEEMIRFFTGFDSEKAKSINGNYNFLQQFLNLVHFDYYFFLRKFDSALPEGNFFYKPNFEAIGGEYITDELKDFIDVAFMLDRPINWDYIQDTLKEYRGVEVVSRTGLKKILKQLHDVQKSGVFEQIIRHIDNDPFFKISPHIERNKIVEPYLSKMKTQTELTLQKLSHEKRSKNIDELCVRVFGTTSISRMKNYSENTNTMFKKKILAGFIYVTPMNYLRAFLIDYCKKDVREVVDLLLVRGKWTSNLLSQQLSDTFHQLVQLSDDLIEFDNSLAEESSIRQKLKQVALRADKDKKFDRTLRQMLKEINDDAKRIVFETAQHLITLGKSLKQMLDDCRTEPPEIIINWKEIETHSDNTIQNQLAEIYKKIYFFVKLLQYYSK